MVIQFSDNKSIDSVSKNFMIENGLNPIATTYYNNHIKVIKNKDIKWLKLFIKKSLKEDVEPFLMTNRGNLFMYVKRLNAVFFYYPSENRAELVEFFDEDFWDWFKTDYLTEEALDCIFDRDLFGVKLEESELLYLPPFLSDIPENYKVMDMNMVYHLYDSKI